MRKKKKFACKFFLKWFQSRKKKTLAFGQPCWRARSPVPCLVRTFYPTKGLLSEFSPLAASSWAQQLGQLPQGWGILWASQHCSIFPLTRTGMDALGSSHSAADCLDQPQEWLHKAERENSTFLTPLRLNLPQSGPAWWEPQLLGPPPPPPPPQCVWPQGGLVLLQHQKTSGCKKKEKLEANASNTGSTFEWKKGWQKGTKCQAGYVQPVMDGSFIPPFTEGRAKGPSHPELVGEWIIVIFWNCSTH